MYSDYATLDCSSVADGTYNVMKSYYTGALSLGTLYTQKTAPTNELLDNVYWLDCSEYPFVLKQYIDGVWMEYNDLVYIGDVTINSGVITKVENNPFNWNGITGSSASMPSNRYINLALGASYANYTAPADGWFSINADASANNGQIYMGCVNQLRMSCSAPSQYGLACSIPVKRGEQLTIIYDNIQNANLIFVYAQGN